MNVLKDIEKILKKHKTELEREFNVKEISIFGSYVRGDHSDESDIDILVDFSEPVGLIKFIKLEEYLEDILCLKVDLVPKKGIKIDLRDSILKEAVKV